MPEISDIAKYRKQYRALDEEFQQGFFGLFKEINDYSAPRKSKYLTGGALVNEENRGGKKHQKIINGVPIMAVRTAAAGMQGGLTSQSRPWFNLGLPDAELADYGPVRTWLHQARETMLMVLSRSNFYAQMHSFYSELLRVGTAVMIIDEDQDKIIRCRTLPSGGYRLAIDDKMDISTLFRPFTMTAEQMEEKFGKDVLEEKVKSAIENNRNYDRFEVTQCVHPNRAYIAGKMGPEGKMYTSVYYSPTGQDNEPMLKKGGYRVKPFVAGRWDVTAGDTYGSSPFMDALGDAKMLQKMEEKKLKALDKMVDPPLQAPSAVKQKGASLVPGGITFVDTMQGQQGISPIYQVNPDIRNMAYEIERVETRIRQIMFNDLFLAIIQQEKTMTAAEVAQRYEEKMVMLGPVVENLMNEVLDPIIDRVFEVMQDRGVLPPAPQELANNTELKVEYTSVLAQAQKMVGLNAIERTIQFGYSLAQANPAVMDKLDFDEALDTYADMMGTTPKIIRPDDKVAELRAQRAQQQKAAQMAALADPAKKISEAAKTASETKAGGSNVLENLASNYNGQ